MVCLLLSLAGAILSAALLNVHAGGTGGLLGAGCAVEGAGCDAVASSRWAVFPPRPEGALPRVTGGGVPVAALGFFYFAMLAVWFAAVGRPGVSRRGMHQIVTGVCVVGAALSVWFIVLMAFVVKAWCPLCLGAHVCNLALLPAVLMARPRAEAAGGQEPKRGGAPRSGRPRKRREAAPPAAAADYPGPQVAILALLLGLAVSWAGWNGYKAALSGEYRKYAEDAEALEMAYFNIDQADLEIREDDPIINAAPGTRNTAVVFSQMVCPHCAAFEQLLFEEIQQMYNGHLRIVFKHYPRDEPTTSREAALALEAARLQGKFWEMQKRLRSDWQDLYSADYVAIAGEIGLDTARFAQDLASPAVSQRVDADIALARRLGVTSTPTVFLNSRRLDGSMRDLAAFWRRRALMLRRLRESNGQDW
jgi:protein-disulfide isomerase/uncharacterized membrane protein